MVIVYIKQATVSVLIYCNGLPEGAIVGLHLKVSVKTIFTHVETRVGLEI